MQLRRLKGMNWTRALGLFVLEGVTFAQDAGPLRYTADLDTVTRYGGKSETMTGRAFVFATGPDGSSKIPAGLKVAFEREAAALTQLGGPAIAYSNSSETVLEAREDGSRVVALEGVTQGSAPLQLGIGQRTTVNAMRLHFADGSLGLEDVVVNVEGNILPNSDEERNDQIRKALAVSAELSVRIQVQVLEACYNTPPGAGVPLLLDPSNLQSVGETVPPASLERARVGDLRVTRLSDGGVECRTNFEPGKYGFGSKLVKIVQRQTLRFASDGRLEHNEWVSSVIFGEVQAGNFEFADKLYRVRSVYLSRTVGASDRLP